MQDGPYRDTIVSFLEVQQHRGDIAANWSMDLIQRWRGKVEYIFALESEAEVLHAEVGFYSEDRLRFHLLYRPNIPDKGPVQITVPWVARLDFPDVIEQDLNLEYLRSEKMDEFIRRMLLVMLCQLDQSEIPLADLIRNWWLRIHDLAPGYPPPVYDRGRVHLKNVF